MSELHTSPVGADADPLFLLNNRYFLLQAALIPIHCLRRNPIHPDAAAWRSQILTSLSIINAMNNLNPSAPKCRDIIHRLCGDSLNSTPHAHRPSQSQQDASWAAFPNDGHFANSFPFSTPDSADSGMNPWMTEIDTAIDGYDIYCDRLSNAAMAGMGRLGNDGGMAAVFASDGTEIGTGVQDWDWGLML